MLLPKQVVQVQSICQSAVTTWTISRGSFFVNVSRLLDHFEGGLVTKAIGTKMATARTNKFFIQPYLTPQLLDEQKKMKKPLDKKTVIHCRYVQITCNQSQELNQSKSFITCSNLFCMIYFYSDCRFHLELFSIIGMYNVSYINFIFNCLLVRRQQHHGDSFLIMSLLPFFATLRLS